MTIRNTLIAIMAFILLGTQPALARHAEQRGQFGHHQTIDWQKKLSLTNQQVQKIDQIKETAQKDMKSLRQQKWQLYKNMMMMSHEKNIDQTKLDELISNMNSISAKMIRHEIKVKHDIYRVLDEKQQAKMNNMMQKKLDRMEKIYGQ